MENINNSPKVLEALWTLFVLHCKYKVKEILVVHFSLVCLIFFENSVNKNVREAWRVASKLLLFEHTVLILV